MNDFFLNLTDIPRVFSYCTTIYLDNSYCYLPSFYEQSDIATQACELRLSNTQLSLRDIYKYTLLHVKQKRLHTDLITILVTEKKTMFKANL